MSAKTKVKLSELGLDTQYYSRLRIADEHLVAAEKELEEALRISGRTASQLTHLYGALVSTREAHCGLDEAL